MINYAAVLEVLPMKGDALEDFLCRKSDSKVYGIRFPWGIFDAIKSFLNDPKPKYKRALGDIEDYSSVALGLILHNYILRIDPDEMSYPRVQTMHELLLTYAERKTSKIFSHTAGLTAELFGYYAAFQSKEADDLADLIVNGGGTASGRLLIQALIAPSNKPQSQHPRACLYTKLHEAIGRQGDVAQWLKLNVAQKHMPAALTATEWAELLPIMNNKTKGNALEDSLGL